MKLFHFHLVLFSFYHYNCFIKSLKRGESWNSKNHGCRNCQNSTPLSCNCFQDFEPSGTCQSNHQRTGSFHNQSTEFQSWTTNSWCIWYFADSGEYSGSRKPILQWTARWDSEICRFQRLPCSDYSRSSGFSGFCRFHYPPDLPMQYSGHDPLYFTFRRRL